MWDALSELAWYSAPLAVFAADFGHRCRARKQAAMIGLMGVALPLFGALLMMGVIGAAVRASTFYQPSVAPNVGMALWSQVASEGRTLVGVDV